MTRRQLKMIWVNFEMGLGRVQNAPVYHAPSIYISISLIFLIWVFSFTLAKNRNIFPCFGTFFAIHLELLQKIPLAGSANAPLILQLSTHVFNCSSCYFSPGSGVHVFILWQAWDHISFQLQSGFFFWQSFAKDCNYGAQSTWKSGLTTVSNSTYKFAIGMRVNVSQSELIWGDLKGPSRHFFHRITRWIDFCKISNTLTKTLVPSSADPNRSMFS